MNKSISLETTFTDNGGLKIESLLAPYIQSRFSEMFNDDELIEINELYCVGDNHLEEKEWLRLIECLDEIKPIPPVFWPAFVLDEWDGEIR